MRGRGSRQEPQEGTRRPLGRPASPTTTRGTLSLPMDAGTRSAREQRPGGRSRGGGGRSEGNPAAASAATRSPPPPPKSRQALTQPESEVNKELDNGNETWGRSRRPEAPKTDAELRGGRWVPGCRRGPHAGGEAGVTGGPGEARGGLRARVSAAPRTAARRSFVSPRGRSAPIKPGVDSSRPRWPLPRRSGLRASSRAAAPAAAAAAAAAAVAAASSSSSF